MSAGKKEEKIWSELHLDILDSISDRLSLQDYMVFRSVCRNWRFAPSKLSDIIYFPKSSHWYMFYGFDNNDIDKCFIYSDSHEKCCQVRVPHLGGATCVMSKSGWLLAKRNTLFFFCNPFSGAKFDLPEYPREEATDQVATFSFLPTSPKCTVFVIRRKNGETIEIISCHVGDSEWHIQELLVSMLMFGDLRFLTYCCDSYCPCGNKHHNKVIVWGSKMHMTYDLENKNLIFHQLNPDAPPKFGTNKRTRDVHHGDWLDKFGKNGISISSCAVQLKGYALSGLAATNVVIPPVDGSSRTELASVKAVWIDPVFERVMCEEDQEKAGASSKLRPSHQSFVSWSRSFLKKAK